MPTDIKINKAQLSKIIQSSGSFSSWLGNLVNKALLLPWQETIYLD